MEYTDGWSIKNNDGVSFSYVGSFLLATSSVRSQDLYANVEYLCLREEAAEECRPVDRGRGLVLIFLCGNKYWYW